MDQELEKYLKFSPLYAGFEFEGSEDRERFLEIFTQLPLPSKSFLSSPQTAEKIEHFGSVNGLQKVQTFSLAAILRYLISSSFYIGSLPQIISENLNIETQTAIELSKKILRDLLAPIIEDLKQTQMAKFGKWPVQTLTPAGQGQQPPSQPRQDFAPQNLGEPTSAPQHIADETSPEIRGNVIDLRNQK